jgi:hypothetical protein
MSRFDKAPTQKYGICPRCHQEKELFVLSRSFTSVTREDRTKTELPSSEVRCCGDCFKDAVDNRDRVHFD